MIWLKDEYLYQKHNFVFSLLDKFYLKKKDHQVEIYSYFFSLFPQLRFGIPFLLKIFHNTDIQIFWFRNLHLFVWVSS